MASSGKRLHSLATNLFSHYQNLNVASKIVWLKKLVYISEIKNLLLPLMNKNKVEWSCINLKIDRYSSQASKLYFLVHETIVSLDMKPSLGKQKKNKMHTFIQILSRRLKPKNNLKTTITKSTRQKINQLCHILQLSKPQINKESKYVRSFVDHFIQLGASVCWGHTFKRTLFIRALGFHPIESVQHWRCWLCVQLL